MTDSERERMRIRIEVLKRLVRKLRRRLASLRLDAEMDRYLKLPYT